MPHLYDSKLGKLRWFVRRFGVWQLFMKPLRVAFAPLILALLRPNTFVVGDQTYLLFYHSYNTTWANERAVEIPFVKAVIDKAGVGEYLEIGNVLSHYYPTHWDIVDKFESAPGVINEDVLTFRPDKRYVLIVSISTFEHIGYDDEMNDSAGRIQAAWNNVVTNCLQDNGRAVITVPVGYNPAMDKLLFGNRFPFDSIVFLKRESRRGWREVKTDEAQHCVYRKPFPCANCVAIGFFTKRAV